MAPPFLHTLNPLPLLKRQSSTPTCQCVSSGAIAGIVLGSIFGTLLLVWMINTTFYPSPNSNRSVISSGGPRTLYGSGRRRSGSFDGASFRFVHSERNGRGGGRERSRSRSRSPVRRPSKAYHN